MLDAVKKALTTLRPEIVAGNHLPKFAEVVNIRNTPNEGDVHNEWNPYYAVDLQLLKTNGKPDTKKPVYENVPLPIPAGNDFMGLMGFPEKGTWVVVMFAYGSAAHPVIMNVLPHGRKMHRLPTDEVLLAKSQDTFLRGTENENWRLVAKNKLHLGNGTVNLVAEVRELARLFKIHKHPGIKSGSSSTSTSDQSGGAADIESKVNTITE